MASPRVLTIKFEFHVPQGLRANIRGKRLDAAVARITGTVQGLTPTVFPWADRVVATYDWSYRWWEDQEDITLPPTSENTVDSPPTPDEEVALLVAE